MDRTCNEIQGFELDDEQKTTACFQLNKEVVCLLQYLLLMVIELFDIIHNHKSSNCNSELPVFIISFVFCDQLEILIIS